MKIAIFRLLFFAIIIHTASADIPYSFDPRDLQSKPQTGIQGCGFIIRPSPLTSNYLIITQLNDENVGNSFHTFEAIADPSLKIDELIGKFVFIKATPVKNPKKGTATLYITSVRQIMKW